MKEPAKNGTSYNHNFGILYTGSIVLTEHIFFNAQPWGYNFYLLGVKMEEDEGKAFTRELNAKFGLNNTGEEKTKFFDREGSKALLSEAKNLFINAEIRIL